MPDAWGWWVFLSQIDRRARRAWSWLRFGRITGTVKAVDGGVPSEVEYTGRFGRVVGYWAYGSWDSQAPYKGADVEIRIINEFE